MVTGTRPHVPHRAEPVGVSRAEPGHRHLLWRGVSGTSQGMAEHADQPWTVLRLLNWTKDYFARVGVGSPRLTAEVLLAHVMDCERIELYAKFADQPSEPQRATFKELVRRAAAHEPAAYLLGYKEFYSLRFRVTADVLIPRGETELIVTEAAAHLRTLGRATTMWDACTGSGCIAVALARQIDDVTVLATDVSPQAVAVAEGNVADHGLDGRVRCMVADLLSGPAGADLPERFDVITANPPYVATDDEIAPEVRHEPRLALYAGDDGLDAIGRIIEQAPAVLQGGGALIMEFGHTQADAVRDLVARSGDFAEPKVLRDLQGIERTVVAVRE